MNTDTQWKQSAKQILDAKELEECTFKPKILGNYDSNKSKSYSRVDRCNELYNKATKTMRDKRDKTHNEYEFEKAKEECTF